MAIFEYRKICQSLLKDLPDRQREVISRRFGLESGKRETLEAIGRDYNISRERIRQIERDGFLRLEPKISKLEKIFQYFIDYLEKSGGLKKEDILLSQLGREKYQPEVFFFLTLGEKFKRYSETKDFHSLWTINPHSLTLAQKKINFLIKRLEEIGKPLPLKQLISLSRLREEVLLSFLEISKIIQQNPEGLFGLKDWSEINPRGIKDKAYLVFKKENQPLHFTKVAELIAKLPFPGISGKPQIATVHNELIRDPRFVLVGRGIYALTEWGYIPGTIKDIILQVLKEAKRPLTKEEILEKVLRQRLVKKNSVLLNLQNQKYFLRNSQGKYKIRKI